MRYLRLLFILLVFCPLSQAYINIDTVALRKAVVFIYGAKANGDADERHPLGTGFLIATRPQGSSVANSVLLITARHIVDPNWAYCSESKRDLVYVRVNKANYDPKNDETGVEYLPIHLIENGKKKYLIRDDDDEVDAAVVPFDAKAYSQKKYDYMPLMLSVLASTDEMKNIEIGDTVVSAGLIPEKSGENRNYPFFKFGNVSNIPEEPTWASCDRKPALRLERVWFIASNLVGGNSGSPIFFVPTSTGRRGGGNFFSGEDARRACLIGIQSLSFDGADIAGMTPIEDAFKIIEQKIPGIDLYRGADSNRGK